MTPYSDPRVDLLRLRPPERLTSKHALDGFDSGAPRLDGWLKDGALRNDAQGAVRVYVVCRDTQAVAFYCLSNGAVSKAGVSNLRRRELLPSVPVMILGRLAVDRGFQGRGLGKALLRDAVLRTLQAADVAGIRALLVHAKDEEARAFYERRGFLPSQFDPRILLLTLEAVRAALDGL